MAGWHHRLNGHRFGQTPGVGDGQGGLACCGSWGCKELDTTERLNGTELWEFNALQVAIFPSILKQDGQCTQLFNALTEVAYWDKSNVLSAKQNLIFLIYYFTSKE